MRSVLNKPDFLVTWLVPFIIFTLVILLYVYGFLWSPSACILISVALAMASMTLIGMRRRGHIWLPLGVAALTSVLTSTALGLYIHDTYAVFPEFYKNSRMYTDVVPSMPSAAVADAGRIVFSADSHVDVSRAVGYMTEDGYTYCVAPVRDYSDTPRIEYWAVGISCCSEKGTFECDQTADEQARAGVRVFDNSGYFTHSNQDFYNKARLKAEAAYGLMSAVSPLYIRWVTEDNLDLLASYYRDRAIIALSAFIMIYMMASAVLAYTLYKPRRTPPP